MKPPRLMQMDSILSNWAWFHDNTFWFSPSPEYVKEGFLATVSWCWFRLQFANVKKSMPCISLGKITLLGQHSVEITWAVLHLFLIISSVLASASSSQVWGIYLRCSVQWLFPSSFWRQKCQICGTAYSRQYWGAMASPIYLWSHWEQHCKAIVK